MLYTVQCLLRGNATVHILRNPYRGVGLPITDLADSILSTDPAVPQNLLSRCPVASPTPLYPVPALSREFGVSSLSRLWELPMSLPGMQLPESKRLPALTGSAQTSHKLCVDRSTPVPAQETTASPWRRVPVSSVLEQSSISRRPFQRHFLSACAVLKRKW